jgi:hypothetical protein
VAAWLEARVDKLQPRDDRVRRRVLEGRLSVRRPAKSRKKAKGSVNAGPVMRP